MSDENSLRISPTTIMGVDYLHGTCERTAGALWVVGNEPELFHLFLPEKWERTERKRLSARSELYYTLTKDYHRIVWKVSKVGMKPDADAFDKKEKKILEFGYNSPFEEVALAMELVRKGIPAICPRAIYMTGNRTQIHGALADNNRYESHKQYLAMDRLPILREDHTYILIRDFWNGSNTKSADEENDSCRVIDALRALRMGLISQKVYSNLIGLAKEKLHSLGIEDLNLGGSHLLLSVQEQTGRLNNGEDGMPDIRLCNFDLLKHRDPFLGDIKG